jgi:heptosyltransferase II
VIRQPVDCSPCFLRECPIDFRCMTLISAERVLGAAEKKLADSGAI